MPISKKKEFHTIDALRFFAFFKIFLLHLPIGGSFVLLSYLKSGGGIGVAFFFVLSGFLITYLLTTEKMDTGHISLPSFYARRALRIWPLLFLLLFLSYLAPMHILDRIGLIYAGGYTPDWRFSFAFVENYRIIWTHNGPMLSSLLVIWSLCIEEHFYIIWSLLIAFIPVRLIPHSMILLIGVAISARVAAAYLLPGYDIAGNEILTSLDYFACGGLVGYLVATYRFRFEYVIYAIPQWLQWCYVIFVAVFFFAHDDLLALLPLSKHLYTTVSALLFAGLIALVTPEWSPFRLDHNNIFSRLGRISYGLYLFHRSVILIWYRYTQEHHIPIDTPVSIALTFFVTLSTSVLIAYILYHYFEKPILSLKRYL